ncbi:hypothetical protein Q7P37_008957 [Cladosporium fusiforme]
MGQDLSAQAQQSINISATRPRMTPKDGMQNRHSVHSMTDSPATQSVPRRRSRSPAGTFSLPQKRRAQSPVHFHRQHSLPMSSRDSSTGRFPSPGSARHRFIREDHDDRTLRDDRELAYQHSSRSSFDNSTVHRDRFRQHSPMTWRTPESPGAERRGSQSPLTLRNSAHRGSISGRRISFDGLKDVPVGPRVDTRIDESAPYIFISSQFLPAQPTLVRHLNGLLKSVKPKQTYVDVPHGWYLIYEDSDHGRDLLHTCYDRFHGELLFNEYPLKMECFENGTQDNRQHKGDVYRRPDGNVTNRPPVQHQPAATSSPSLGRFNERDIAYPEPLNGKVSISAAITSDWRDERVDSTRVPDDEAAHVPVNKSLPVASSQLSLRSDRDETTSLASGVTPSDASRSKRLRCHVCKEEGIHGPSNLVHCTTCSRRYHRRCHQKYPIPLDLPDGHRWSCRSCVKKGILQKEGTQSDGHIPRSSLGPASPQQHSLQRHPDPSAAPRDGQLDGSDSVTTRPEPHVPPPTEAKNNQTDSPKPLNGPCAQNSIGSSTDIVKSTNDDGQTLSDADDLVEQSFASAEKKANMQHQPLRTSRLKMTRVKLAPSAPEITYEQANSLGNLAEGHSLPKDDRMKRSVQAPESRLSAAKLRELALDRHLARRADGAESEPSVQAQPPRNLPSTGLGDPAFITESVPNETSKSISAAVASVVCDQLEIPESPDDVRKGAVKVGDKTLDPLLSSKGTAMMDISATDVPSAKQDSVLNKTSLDHLSKQSLSKRSRGPTFTVCQGCKKKTPVGPSGKNRLCTLCKKKQTTEGRSFTTNAPSIPRVSPESIEIGARQESNEASVETAPAATRHVSQGPWLNRPREEENDAVERSGPNAPPNGNHDSTRTSLTSSHQAAASGEPSQAGPATVDQDGDVDMTSTEHAHEDATNTSRESFEQSPNTSMKQRETAQNNMEPFNNIGAQQSVQINGLSMQGTNTIQSEKLDKIKNLLGDSFERPKGSRAILVGMALCSAPNNRLRAKSITDWIAENIPTYKHGEGNWYARIVSQLSQGRVTESGHGLRYWRDGGWDAGDEGTPGLRWYELLPERADTMWTWCPVLKEPLAPRQHQSGKAVKTARAKNGSKKRRATLESVPSNAASGEGSFQTSFESHETVRHRAEDKAEGRATIQPDTSAKTQETTGPNPGPQQHTHRADMRESTPKQDNCSSDDEPLSHRRRRSSGIQPMHTEPDFVQHDTPVNTEMEGLPDAESSALVAVAVMQTDETNEVAEVPLAPVHPMRPGLVKLSVPSLRVPSLRILPVEDRPVDDKGIKAKLASSDFSAISLFDEWPEWRNANTFDAQEKLKEIQNRPTRKQMFGKPASQTRLHPNGPPPISPMTSNTARTTSTKRSRPLIDAALNELYPWENPDVDPTRKEYKTLEEFFALPANMIPIISDGQLAYRDGTRTDDGRLPRAREVFKP